MRKGAGLLARPERGIVQVRGVDSIAFLNNLLTNGLIERETKTALPVGHGTYSFWLNLRGRVVAAMNVLRIDEETILLETDAHRVQVLIDGLDQFRFREKAKLTDETDAWSVLDLHGPMAMEILGHIADGPVSFDATPANFPATVDLPIASFRTGGVDAIAWRDDTCGVPGIGLLVPTDKVAQVWDDWVGRLGQTDDDREFGRRKLRPIGWAMFNACRIEAGMPMPGIDFAYAAPSKPGRKPDPEEAAKDDPKGGSLPAETGPLFEKGVSVTSGCYLGQEVVARMHARQVTAKKLVGLRMEDDALPSAGVPVEIDDKVVGIVTSSTLSPVLSGACICLATIKRPHFEIGTDVTIPAEGRNAKAKIVKLPFIQS